MRVHDIPTCAKFYDSLDSAFENYANSEGIDPYKKIASQLGHTGNERATQIYRKMNPNCPDYRFYADELVFILKELGVYSAPVAQYFLGISSSSMQNRTLTLSQTASAFSRVFGDFNARLIDSLSDGSISPVERNSLVGVLDTAIVKLTQLRQSLDSQNGVNNVGV